MLLGPGERHAGWPIVDDHAADRTGYLIDDLAGVWVVVVVVVHDHTRRKGTRQLEQRGPQLGDIVVFRDQRHRAETFLEEAAANPQRVDGYPKDRGVYRPARISTRYRPDDFGSSVEQLAKSTVEGICYPLCEHHWARPHRDESVSDELGSTRSARGEE